MNFADYIIIPLELITWVLCGIVKKLFKQNKLDTSWIPYIAMGFSTVLAIAMHFTSDIVGGNNIWEVIVIGVANGCVAVGINEASKITKDSNGNEVTVVPTESADELWEENIDEEEKDAEEEIVDDYKEDDVEEATVDSSEANG